MKHVLAQVILYHQQMLKWKMSLYIITGTTKKVITGVTIKVVVDTEDENIAKETTMHKAVIKSVKIEEMFLKTDSTSSLQRQRNPPDVNGYTSRCIICKSIFHWAKDCPDRNKEEVSGDKHKVILFNEEIENCYIETFLGETINKAILDSGCTETVCGNVWLQCYLDSLNKEESAKVQSQSSSKVFRFGNGKFYDTTRKVIIPAMIGDTEVHIETQVVNCDLPLLLSKNSMQKARTKNDFQKNKAIMFDKEIDLRFTTSGHYYIPLKSENSNETLLSLSETSDLKDKKKVAYKLHKQFSHPRAHKLQKLLQDAGIFDKELLNEIEAIEGECTICQKYKKPPPKPIVTFPFAKDFNESVAMDIKFYSGKPILHLIDHTTRFSAASVIHSKGRDVVISKIFEIWISLFGVVRNSLNFTSEL